MRLIYAAFLRGATVRAIRRALAGDAKGLAADAPMMPRPSYIKNLEMNERHKDEPGFKPRPLPKNPYAWDSCAITRILHDPKYTGFSAFGDRRLKHRQRREQAGEDVYELRVRDEETGEWVRLKNWTPLVSEEDWERAQAILDAPVRRYSETNTHVHLGSGLYRCSVCGERIRLNGRCYSCKTMEPGHSTRAVKTVDEYVEAIIMTVLPSPDIVRDVHVSRAPGADRADELAAEIERLRERQQALARSAAERDVSPDLLVGMVKEIDDRVNALTVELNEARCAEPAVPALIAEPTPAEEFPDAPLDVKRAVIDLLCDVYLTPAEGGGRGKGYKHPSYDVTMAVEIRWKTAAEPQ